LQIGNNLPGLAAAWDFRILNNDVACMGLALRALNPFAELHPDLTAIKK